MFTILYEFLKELFIASDFTPRYAVYSTAFCIFISMIITSIILYYIFRVVFVKVIGGFVARTKGVWDDELFRHKVFHVLAHLVPAILIYCSAGFGAEDMKWFPIVVRSIAKIYIWIVMITAFCRFLNASLDIYNSYPFAHERPIKGYIQLIKMIVYFVGGIVVVSILIGQNPNRVFTGLGAMAAVLMLVFRDPILGLAASIQLAANKMVKPGDWITVPKFNVDGTVEDISLTTVKVQNWDKTITTIPTYSLVTESVTNWIGMQESGGRRIQRNVAIDLACVRFCDENFLFQIAAMPIIRDYNSIKFTEDDSYIGWINTMQQNPTNLAVFRSYLEAFLRVHPTIHKDMTIIVRYLQPTERGLPLEFIVFSKEQQSNLYEGLQAEIIDHILATLPNFGLRVFQSPSGTDFQHKLNV